MKKMFACILALCLLAAWAAPGLAAGNLPAFADRMLYKNLLGELDMLGVAVDLNEPLVYSSTSVEPHKIYIAMPAEDITFGIVYENGIAIGYTLYAPAYDDLKSVYSMMAFARTFFDNTMEDAKGTISDLLAGGEEDEDGNSVYRIFTDDATYEYGFVDGSVVLSYLPNP